MISVTLYKDTAVLYTVYRGREYERVISGHGEVKAEKPPASPQCTDCPLWKYGAVSCARFNLRYALNEMLKELPFFCRTAEEKIVCPHKEAKK